jgi:hypothetical protein
MNKEWHNFALSSVNGDRSPYLLVRSQKKQPIAPKARKMFHHFKGVVAQLIKDLLDYLKTLPQ